MARSKKMSVQKRQRERQKAEKAALKREQRARREPGGGASDQTPTREDLEAYGVIQPRDEEED